MKKSILIIAMLFIALFASSSSAFAQSSLENYTDRLLATLDQEIDTINDFVSVYERADFDSELDISLFQSKINSYRSDFNSYLSFYKSSLPANAPSDLKSAVSTAQRGTELIIQGINAIDSALDSRSNAELQRGQNLLNNGTDQVNNAITKYNAWVDSYNAEIQAQGGEPLDTSSFGADSTFATTWKYAKPLAYLYLYLFVAGLILTFAFRARLKSLAKGKTKEFKGAPIYGIHLLLLFPYLYALLAFLVLVVWDIALIGILYVTYSPRIHLGILIGIGVVVLGTGWAILKGFFAAKKRNILGTKITSEDQPKIWEVCDRIAKEVGTKPVDEIYISPQPGIGVHLSGGLFSLLIGRTKRTLTIGMPSISSLSVSEMEAILAHEFGHFSNKDTAWNSLTFTMGGALQNTWETIPKPSGGNGFSLVTLVIALNPALWILAAYRLLFSVMTSGFSRMREVLADKTAIALFGYQNFTNGLMRVARNDYVFSSYFVPEMLKMLTEEGKMYTNIFQTMDQTYKSIKQNHLADIDKSILEQEKPSIFDSHPSLKDRMAYAKQFEVQPEHKTDNADFKTLFKDWGNVSKNMSDLYTYYIAILTGHKFEDEKEQEQS
ncbi:MAG: M48 family metalloprotease [Candidatus Marinimicrobia bacterium]|nr:M48 family metalloprotease [Candidatus Neomarinimicrobiota bacterium]